MDKYSDNLNLVFHALSDPTRRQVMSQLCEGEASVGELAESFDMALPSFMKHIKVLEDCGVINTRKEGRIRYCEITDDPLNEVSLWVQHQRALWDGRFDRLEKFLATKNSKV